MLNKNNINEASWNNLFYDEFDIDNKRSYIKKDKKRIKKIDMLSNDVNQCKVYTDGKSVYANANFYPNDIIEICPTKKINITSLYSRDMRDIILETIPGEEYVIPFGYCQFYDIKDKFNEPNCDYLWDSISKVLVIKALTKIYKGEKLVLNLCK